MNPWDDAIRRHAREFMRAWRQSERDADEGRLRDLKRRLDYRLTWYQLDKPIKQRTDQRH
jgi:hypothetical protein